MKRIKTSWSIICSVAVILGIIDFYLNWIKPLRIDIMKNDNILLIIGILGLLGLIISWTYWIITDLKTAINTRDEMIMKIISTINNNAECLDQKVTIKNVPMIEGTSFMKTVDPILPQKIDTDEFSRNIKQV